MIKEDYYNIKDKKKSEHVKENGHKKQLLIQYFNLDLNEFMIFFSLHGLNLFTNKLIWINSIIEMV